MTNLTPEIIDTANRRGAAKKAAALIATSVRYDRRIARVVIGLSSGLEVAFLPAAVQGLGSAKPADLADAEISPSGLGIHFPRVDADIYLPALLEGFLGSKKWMAAELGRRGGKTASAAKTTASRKNGKLGGRPRKDKIEDRVVA